MEGESGGSFWFSVSLAGDGAHCGNRWSVNSQVAQRAGHVRVYHNGLDWVQLGADIDGAKRTAINLTRRFSLWMDRRWRGTCAMIPTMCACSYVCIW
jgi:hypothetical protein